MKTCANSSFYLKIYTAQFFLISSKYFLDPKTLSKNCLTKEHEEISAKKNFTFSILLFPVWKLILSASIISFNSFVRIFLFSLSFLLQFSQIFIFPWSLYNLVVFIAKLPDENLVLVVASLLLKLFKFRFYSFLKDFLCLWKKLFFLKYVGVWIQKLLALFGGKLMFIFRSFLINFISRYISFLSISFLLSSVTIDPFWFSVTVIIKQRDHEDKILFCM